MLAPMGSTAVRDRGVTTPAGVLDEPALSAYGCASRTPAPVSRMMAAFAADFRDGVDVNLGLGSVNEATLPRGPIQQALAAVLADAVCYRAPLNYGGPATSSTTPAPSRACRCFPATDPGSCTR